VKDSEQITWKKIVGMWTTMTEMQATRAENMSDERRQCGVGIAN
jgi:hypothetical protein